MSTLTKDNVLFTIIGILGGFIGGYFAHEAVVASQPPRAPIADQSGNPHSGLGIPAPPPGATAPGAAQPAGPSMEQISNLRQAVEDDPTNAVATLALANLNYDIRNWGRAAELYQRYLDLDGPDPDVLTDLGVCLRGLGRYDEALARFDEAQTLVDGHWQSLYNEIVVLAFDKGDLDATTEPLSELVALQPDNPEVDRLATEIERRRTGSA